MIFNDLFLHLYKMAASTVINSMYCSSIIIKSFLYSTHHNVHNLNNIMYGVWCMPGLFLKSLLRAMSNDLMLLANPVICSCFTVSNIYYTVQVRGVLGNKCAGQHNLKTVEIREIMWKYAFLHIKAYERDQLNELFRQ
jgi:hypothetical protein